MKLPPLFALHGEPKFVTDGCSGYMTWAWSKIFGHKPPWDGGCVIHDWYYWSGGLCQCERPKTCQKYHRTRREADAFLFNYVRRKGFPVWAWLMWLGVRLGGSQYLPFSWRWRYRERYRDVLGV